jgi:tetratricopeptide (TPR) repeat protein
MDTLRRIRDRLRQSLRKKHLAVGLSVLLGFIPASTPYGAVRFLPVCESEPPPSAAWAVLWYPRDPGFALAAGRELLARPDYPAALCYLNAALSAADDNPQYLAALGDAYWGTGGKEQALAYWERALALDPDLDRPLGLLWHAYWEKAQWAKAEEAIGRRLALQADDAEAKYALALIYASRNPGSALKLLDELASAPAPFGQRARLLAEAIRGAIGRQNPEYIFARTGEVMLQLNEPALAEEALRRAIDWNPKYGEAYALMGLALEAAGENPEEAYRRGVALAPESALACLAYGAWLHRQGDLTLARWWLMQSWAAQPGDWMIASELAQVDFILGNVTSAEEWVLEAVAAHPSEPEAWIALAAFYIENDFRVKDSGIPAARQAVILAPQNDRALDVLGLGWFKLGDLSAAERSFLQAINRNPESAAAHLHLGICYREQGRLADAQAEWEAALRLDPDGSIGRRAGELLGAEGSGIE